jgi:hypothetical protein
MEGMKCRSGGKGRKEGRKRVLWRRTAGQKTHENDDNLQAMTRLRVQQLRESRLKGEGVVDPVVQGSAGRKRVNLAVGREKRECGG